MITKIWIWILLAYINYSRHKQLLKQEKQKHLFWNQNLKASKDIAAETYKPVQENITSGLSTPLHFGHAGMW
jgi:hypothetical protein